MTIARPLTMERIHRRSQDFLWGCTFLDQKNLMTFFSHHPLLHGHTSYTATNYLFYLICGGAPYQNQLHFPSFQQIRLEKKFSLPWGCTCTTCTSLATPMKEFDGAQCSRTLTFRNVVVFYAPVKPASVPGNLQTVNKTRQNITTMMTVYRVRKKIGALEFFSVFSGLLWNFKAKFYALM